MVYLTIEELVAINRIVVDESGGTAGLCDVGLLEAVIHKPQASFAGEDLYPDLFTKAAVLYEGVINYHAFVDGNKRTAVAALGRFLALNHYDFVATNQEIVKFTVKIAVAKLKTSPVSSWIKRHACKMAAS